MSEQLFVGLIPDGGRRAVDYELTRYAESYDRGATVVGDVLKACVADSRVRIFTAWCLSDDNASKRSPAELEILNMVFMEHLERLRENLETDEYGGVKVVHMGNEKYLNPKLVESIHDITKLTAERTEKIFGLCLGYGAHDEMNRAVDHSHAEPERDWKEFLDLPGRSKEPYRHVDVIVRTGVNPLKPYTSGYLLPYQGGGTQERYIQNLLPNTSVDQIMNEVDDVWNLLEKRRLGA